MNRSVIGCVIGAVLCLILAWLIAPLIPEPTVSHIIAIIGWVGLVLCALYAVYLLVTGRDRTV